MWTYTMRYMSKSVKEFVMLPEIIVEYFNFINETVMTKIARW